MHALPDAPLTLVTGFPNAVTRRLVARLIEREPERQVVVVVGPDQREAARPLLPAFGSSLVLVEGDATAIDFGLSGPDYAMLCERVERVFHFAGEHSASLGRDALDRVNVGSMREVLELGRMARRLKSLTIGSSTLVSGRFAGHFRESDLNVGQGFRTHSEQSLATAELMARRVADRLPLSILRPSHVVGDSVTGEFDAFDGPYPFVALILGAPQDLPPVLPTRGDEQVNLVPCDYVADAALHVGLDPAALGRTFHLVDENPPTVRRLYELVAQRAGKRPPNASLPANLTSALLKTPGVHRLSKNQSAFLDVVRTPVSYETTNTREWVASVGVICPRFEDLVGPMVESVRRRLDRRTLDAAADRKPRT